MSETREAYNVTLQPGRELDIQVMRVMHRVNVANHLRLAVYSKVIDSGGDAPPFSTNLTVAMGAWAWLEDNHPWKGDTLALMRYDNKPSVCRLMDYDMIDTVATGDTYPHAIALAILEISKTTGGPNESA